MYMGVGGEKGEKRLGALVLRLTSEVGAHNKIQSDRTNHRSPTGEIGGFDWTYGNWLSNELISLTPRPDRWAIITDRVADCLAIAYFLCFRFRRGDFFGRRAELLGCSQFGVESLKPLQCLALCQMVRGDDVLACFPTGDWTSS